MTSPLEGEEITVATFLSEKMSNAGRSSFQGKGLLVVPISRERM